MNELQEIRAMLTEDPPSREAEARGRERLGAEIRRRRPRVRRPLIVGLGLTAAAAALSLVATTLISAPRAPDPGPVPTARQYLLAAAKRQVPADGDYLHMKLVRAHLKRVGPADDPYFIKIWGVAESWMSMTEEPKGPLSRRVRPLVRLHGEPATADDVAAWKRDGSPGQWGSPKDDVIGSPDCVSFGITEDCGVVHSDPRKVPYSELFEGGGRQDPRYEKPIGLDSFPHVWLRPSILYDLPADPEKLRSVLLDAVPKRDGSEVDRLWRGGVAVVAYAPVSAEVRRAAYQMLADLPGVRSLGPVKDASGRSGVAVARRGPRGDVSGIDTKVPGEREFRLVIDPSTGQALATETRLSRPEGWAAGLPPGALWSYTLIQSVDWTDDVGPNPPDMGGN